MKYVLFFLLLCISNTSLMKSNRKVIVIGAGAAGIAAASKLMQNGFDDVIILEVENRYGGRIYSTRIGEYWGDLGAQWVHGTEGNVVYELASPLGLLSTSRGPGEPEEPPFQVKLCGSSGNTLPAEVTQGVFDYIDTIMHNYTGLEDLKTGSVGEYVETRFNEWLKTHPEINDELRKSLLHNVKLTTLSEEGADDWNKVSVFGSKDAPACLGFNEINWKERAYDTIFDIMMKRHPNAENELPVLNKTFLNKKVCKINYAEEGPVRVTTTDGHEYTADHVIFTGSLGVLKADHEKIFEPSLPEKNRNAIQRIGMGRNAKILMYYENPWWKPRNHTLNSFYWTEKDRKEIENDPERSWILGIIDDSIVEYKPKLYLLWMSGPYAEQMERIPDEQFKKQIVEFLRKFFGSTCEITEPTKIIRSFWNTNDNFRGTYSYQTMQSVRTHVGPRDLGAPVMRKGVPVLQFAGEATDPAHFSTVHGAITSGWREADRLINFYNQKLSDQ
ncbi:spermine oxidase [Diachasma alloeum]|uniref:spermine oxidase n=1 Tax=Diachasma alloeum TaxID=454923 RepID=UPI0007383418|nr:spermine oxidase [Diachasma alloeum]